MKLKCICAWLFIAGISLGLSFTFSVADDREKQTRPSSGQTDPSSHQTPVAPDATKQGKEVSGSMPVYRPPLRGAPKGRLAGGTRAPREKLPALIVLTPDHLGLTVSEQPVLYWFLSALTNYPIELTIIEAQAVKPLLETRIKCPTQPGIQSIRLADHGVRLQMEIPYQWFVSIVPDSNQRSRDVLTGGEIKRIALPDTFRLELNRADKARAPHIYAEAGIWYDALSAISNLCETSPDSALFREQRASLLRQVGLAEIADFEMGHSGTGK